VVGEAADADSAIGLVRSRVEAALLAAQLGIATDEPGSRPS
jgi:hypothetical protein